MFKVNMIVLAIMVVLLISKTICDVDGDYCIRHLGHQTIIYI